LFLYPTANSDLPAGSRRQVFANFNQVEADSRITFNPDGYRLGFTNTPFTLPTVAEDAPGAYLPADADALTRFVEDLPPPADEPSFCTLPFDNAPVPAVQHLCRRIAEREFFPLPVFIAGPAAATEPFDQLVECVVNGLDAVELSDALSRAAVEALLDGRPNKVVLVVFSSKSAELDFARDERRFRELLAAVATLPARPRVLVLASDEYHRAMLARDAGRPS
jgi:hypothetical protein